jgi:hypothetical protein
MIRDSKGRFYKGDGTHHSEEHKQKISISQIGRKLSDEHKRKLSLSKIGTIGNNRGKKHRDEAKQKMSNSHKGKIPWNKGIGNLSLNQQIRTCLNYLKWRSSVFQRDNWTCQTCGVRGGKLESHHSPKSFAEIINEFNVKTFEQALECSEFWNLDNGVTLCYNCHKLTKKGGRKK